MSALKLTLEDLKKHINSNSSVYYSSGNLWWTHSDTDLKEATEMGLVSQKKAHDRFMNDPNKSQVDKDRLQSLMDGLDKHHKQYGNHTPLDPYGCPLMKMSAQKWIDVAEHKPEHFGKYQLEAFMKTHHQNDILKSSPFMDWKDVTDRLDGFYSVQKRIQS